LANEQSNAKCLQVYFLDPDYQATLRATRYLSDARAAPDEQDVEIFSRLRTSLVDEANNTYIASFLTVVEWIRQNRIDPEEVQIQLHETEKPGQGQHVGRFHLYQQLQKYLFYCHPESKCPFQSHQLYVRSALKLE
jgi:hypothetical protein